MNLAEYQSPGALLPEQKSKEDKHYLEWANEQVRWSRETHESDWCDKAFMLYKHFRNIVEDASVDPDSYHTNVGVGVAFPIVKIISASLLAPFQAGDQIIDAVALDAPGVERAPKAAAYVNDVIINQVHRSFSKVELVKESGVALGRGILKMFVRTEPPQSLLRRLKVQLGGLLGMNIQMDRLQFENQSSSRVYDFDYVDPFNFWWVGSSRWLSDCDFTVERSYISHMGVLRRMQSGEWNRFDVSRQDALGWDEYTASRLNLEVARGGEESTPAEHRPHRLIEIQGWVESNKRKEGYPAIERRVIQILDEKYVVKNKPLGTWNGKPSYLSYEPMLDMADEKQIGTIEPIEQALLVLNDFINIAMDNAKKGIETPLAIDPSTVKDINQKIYFGPAEINWIRNPTHSIAPIPIRDLPRSFYELFGLWNDLVQRISGVSDYFGGLNTADSERLTKTAKGMELMTNLATRRFAPFLKKADLELYRPLATDIHETAKLTMQGERQVAMPGNPEAPFTTIKPNDLDAMFQFRFNVKALDVASGRRRAEFVEMMGLLGQLAQSGALGMQGYYLDAYETARILLAEFDREASADRIVKRVEQMAGSLAGPGGPFATPGGGMLPGAPMPPGGAEAA